MGSSNGVSSSPWPAKPKFSSGWCASYAGGGLSASCWQYSPIFSVNRRSCVAQLFYFASCRHDYREYIDRASACDRAPRWDRGQPLFRRSSGWRGRRRRRDDLGRARLSATYLIPQSSAASPRPARAVRSAVLLEPRGPQAREAVRLERALPRAVLLLAQLPAAERLFERDATAAHGYDDRGFAAHHPTPGVRRRQIVVHR